jgi:hypothetical protein
VTNKPIFYDGDATTNTFAAASMDEEAKPKAVGPDLSFLDGLAAESVAEDKIKAYAAKAQAYASVVSASIRQASLAAQQQATAQ